MTPGCGLPLTGGPYDGCANGSRLLQAHIFIFKGQPINPALGRRDPRSNLPRFKNAVHAAINERAVVVSRQPFTQARVVFLAADDFPGRINRNAGPTSNIAAKTRAGECHSETVAEF